MRLAYENLEDDIRNKIETLYCEHSLIYSRQRLGFDMEKELSKRKLKTLNQFFNHWSEKLKKIIEKQYIYQVILEKLKDG